MRSSRNHRQNRLLDLGVILLANELLSVGFDAIPPVTLVTVIGQILLYAGVVDVPWQNYEVCISGNKVWYQKDWKSMILSTFEHADDMHLYYNMISYLVKGRSLEMKHGSVNFALLLAVLCILTPIMYVALAVVGSEFLEMPFLMKECAIGFSGVIFALKVLTTIESGGYTSVLGFGVPIKYSAWAELLAIHFLSPRASFLGHLAGILAGLLYKKTPLKYVIDAAITSISGQRMGSGSQYRSSRTHSDQYYSTGPSAPPYSSSQYYQRPFYSERPFYGFREEYQFRNPDNGW